MKKAFFRCSLLTAAVSGYILLSIPVTATAQEVENKKKEEIIIQKKKDKDEKMTIVIDGDKVTVNGEPLSVRRNRSLSFRIARTVSMYGLSSTGPGPDVHADKISINTHGENQDTEITDLVWVSPNVSR